MIHIGDICLAKTPPDMCKQMTFRLIYLVLTITSFYCWNSSERQPMTTWFCEGGSTDSLGYFQFKKLVEYPIWCIGMYRYCILRFW